MARIVGVDLPSNKRGEIALTYIYGIGRSSARAILSEAGIDYDLKVTRLERRPARGCTKNHWNRVQSRR